MTVKLLLRPIFELDQGTVDYLLVLSSVMCCTQPPAKPSPSDIVVKNGQLSIKVQTLAVMGLLIIIHRALL